MQRNAITKFKRPVPIPLDDQELAQRAHELARLHGQREQLKEERRDVMAKFRERFNGLDSRLDEISKEVETGRGSIEVECTRRARGLVWEIVRLDTGEVIASEAMTEADRQLNTDEAPATAAAGAEDEEGGIDAPPPAAAPKKRGPGRPKKQPN